MNLNPPKRWTILALMGVVGLVGCLPAEPMVEETPLPTIVTPIHCTGTWDIGPSEPFTSTDSLQPLHPAKTDGQSLLALQIYAKPIGAADKLYQPFAYGLFDTWQSLEVELVATNAYKMIASLVVEAKTKLEPTASGYSEPFAAGSERSQITNAFVYTSARAMKGLTAGAARVVDGRRYTRPVLERHCAVLSDYLPADKQVAELTLQRVSFALRVSAPDVTEGKIELDVDGAPLMVLSSAERSVEAVVSMQGSSIDERWLTADYADEVLCKATWTKANGTRVPIGASRGVTLRVRRNERIPIELYTRGKASGLGILTETNTWVDQTPIVF